MLLPTSDALDARKAAHTDGLRLPDVQREAQVRSSER